MNKYFSWYCIFLVSFLAYANYQGYVLSNMFGNQSQASQSANHYHK